MTNHRLSCLGFAAILLAALGCGDSPVANPEPVPRPAAPILPPEPKFTVEEGFESLAFDDFSVFESKPAETPSWRAAGRRIECLGGPKGYLYTNADYDDFTLRFDYRYPDAPKAADPAKLNTGVLVYITGEHRAWPRCLEVQGRFDEMCQIKSNARDVTVETTDDQAARVKARHQAGEWNSIEVVSKDGALTSYLNGEKIAASQPTELVNGPLGFQSEGNTVHFRYVRIRRD